MANWQFDIVKRVRTSGGDFTTLDGFRSWMQSNFSYGTPISGDVIVNIQAGMEVSASVLWGVDFGISGYKIILQTDASDDIATSGLARVKGYWMGGAPANHAIDRYTVYKNLIFYDDSSNVFYDIFGQKTVSYLESHRVEFEIV